MARSKNELSVTQLNPDVFYPIASKILKYTPDYLQTFGLASRTTFYKYADRKPINPGKEDAVFKSIELADLKKKEQTQETLNRARQLAEA